MRTIFKKSDILKEYLHIFKKEEQWYAYANAKNRVWTLDDIEAKIILDYMDGKNSDDIDNSLDIISGSAENLIEEILLEIKPTLNANKKIKLTPKVKSMILLISEGCNFACTYCFGQYGEKNAIMDEKTALNAVDLAKKLEISELGFFGGEPLLNFELIKTVVEYIEKNNLSFNLGITTNGSLVTEKIARYLADKRIHVSVSMDGEENQHNKTRVYKNGEKTYEDVERGIELLKKYNVLNLIEVTYSARHTTNLKSLMKGAYSLHNVVSCACVDGRKGCCHQKDVISKERLVDYYKDMMEISFDKNLDNVNVIGVKEMYNKIGKGELQRTPYLCSDIGERIIISAEGLVYPCPETINPEFCIGDVKEPNFHETFENNRMKVLSKLTSNKLNRQWFSTLCETCIQHVSQDANENFDLEEPEWFGKCVEEVLVRYVKENEV